MILMKAPNNEGDRVPTGHLLSPDKLLVLGLDYFQMNCWPKDSHGYLQTRRAVAERIGCSLQTNSNAPLVNTLSWTLFLLLVCLGSTLI